MKAVLLDTVEEPFIPLFYRKQSGRGDPFNRQTNKYELKKRYEILRLALLKQSRKVGVSLDDTKLGVITSTIGDPCDSFIVFPKSYDGGDNATISILDFASILSLSPRNEVHRVTITTNVPLLLTEWTFDDYFRVQPVIDIKGRYVHKIPIGSTTVDIVDTDDICFLIDSDELIMPYNEPNLSPKVDVEVQGWVCKDVTEISVTDPCGTKRVVSKVHPYKDDYGNDYVETLINESFRMLKFVLQDERDRLSVARSAGIDSLRRAGPGCVDDSLVKKHYDRHR